MQQPDAELIEGELLPDVYERPAALGLFGTDDPELVIAKAADVAKVLARVVRDRKLFARINGKDYVLIGGWTLLGSMLGVFPVVVWTRKLEDGWESRVEARTRAGEVVGAAESECLRSERKWAKADDYAVRSMSQTRSTSKALRLGLGFVFELEGFQGTPAEEFPGEPETVAPAGPPRATILQKQKIAALFRRLERTAPDVDWTTQCAALAGPSHELTETAADAVLAQMDSWLVELQGSQSSMETES